MKKNTEKVYNAPALEKGLEILEYLSSEAVPVSQTQLAEKLNRNINEIFRMLVCLVNKGYIIRDEISGKYRLSLKLYTLSHRHTPMNEIVKVSQYPMQELSEEIKQACHLCTIYREHLLIINQCPSPGLVSLSIQEGGLMPLLTTSSGRVLLAYMDEAQRSITLERNEDYRKFSNNEKQRFLNLLKKIRKQEYYSGESGITKGVTDVVVPIGSTENFMFTCLSVSALTNQIDEKMILEKIIMKTQKAAAEILMNLGG